MEEAGTPLIRNRSIAFLVVLATGYLAALAIRTSLSQSPYKPSWLLELDWLHAPNWAIIAANGLFYITLVYACISIYGKAKGKERFIVLGYSAGLLILPLKLLAGPRGIFLIRNFQSVCYGIAFLAALPILLESPPFGKNDAATTRKLALFVGALVLSVLVFGALVYFFPR